MLLEALEINPEYGSAHSLLAYLYAIEAPEYWGIDNESRYGNAERELRLARSFGSDEAHNLATEAFLSSARDGRHDIAARLMSRANGLAPDDPWVLRLNLLTDIVTRDFSGALQRNMRAAELSVDPSSVLAERIVPLYFSGRYDEAVELYEATRELDLLPVYHGPQAAVLAGDDQSGFLLWIDLLEAHGLEIDDPSVPMQQIVSGDVKAAYDWLVSELPANPSGKNAALIQASWLMTCGEADEAMDVLLAGARKTFDGPGPSPAPTFLWAVFQHDPIFAELRDDPRMSEVLSLVGGVPSGGMANSNNAMGGTLPSSAKVPLLRGIIAQGCVGGSRGGSSDPPCPLPSWPKRRV